VTHTRTEREKERERETETVVGSCPLTAHLGGSGIPHAVAAINCQLQLNLMAVELQTFLFSF